MGLAIVPIGLSLCGKMPEPLALSLTALCVAVSSLELSFGTRARVVDYMERLLKIAEEEPQ